MTAREGEISMKTVLLAGGLGTRITEESERRPKPMVEIGGMPILWHIMKGDSHFGFNDFIICAGYQRTSTVSSNAGKSCDAYRYYAEATERDSEYRLG